MPPWRYIQCEYAIRLLSEGFFGQDVNIPALTVTYNLQSRGAGSARARSDLPPAGAADARAVDRAEERRRHSRRLGADVCRRSSRAAFALDGDDRWRGSRSRSPRVLGIFALVRAGRAVPRPRYADRPAAAGVVDAAWVAAALRASGATRRAEGWSPELSRRAACRAADCRRARARPSRRADASSARR